MSQTFNNGDRVQIQDVAGRIKYGTYSTSHIISDVTHEHIPIEEVLFIHPVSRYNPRNTSVGDRIIYDGVIRTVEALVAHGVRLQECEDQSTSFVAFSVIEGNIDLFEATLNRLARL